jgi:penicillin-binding protein 2
MLSTILPSLFHRRLLLLGGLFIAAGALPALQLARLTLVSGDRLRGQAESRLQASRTLPTTRGKILDRMGRVLATSRPSYDIAVDYPVITGEWSWQQAARRARRLAGPRWAEMKGRQREEMIQEIQPELAAQLDEAWNVFCQVSGMSRADLEARKNQIIEQVTRTAAGVRERERAKREEAAGGAGATGGGAAPSEPTGPIREQTIPHVILSNVPDRLAFEFLSLVDRGPDSPPGTFVPGLRVIDTAGREYPFDSFDVLLDRSTLPGTLRSDQPVSVRVSGVGVHVLGMMRTQFTQEDEQARAAALSWLGENPESDLGAYRPGDTAGRSGVERWAEFELRGRRGSLVEQVDAGTSQRIEPVPGQDVPLTIDIQLQGRVQALLDPRVGLTKVQPWHGNHTVGVGESLAGAAVVIDVASGEVLALVTSPSFTRDQFANQPEELFEDPISAAFVNRAVAKPYPPGSIVKPLVLASAVSAGVSSVDRRIDCTGHFLPNNKKTMQCWVFKQFQTTHTAQLGHELDAAEAIMVSCNIYFYTLGKALGPRGIIDWYGRWGVGETAARLGIGEQFLGTAGNPQDAAKTTIGEATLMGIGQGPVAWTPLHAADAYATLARGGVRIPAHLRRDRPPTRLDLGLDQGAVRKALEGLKRAVRDDRGSGHHVTVTDALGNSVREIIFNAPRVEVWGKSGTADAPAILGPRDEDEPNQPRAVLRDGDHSWLVCLVGPAGGQPKFAVAVVVDYGGSGGKVAGPIANQIIHALIAEGYL